METQEDTENVEQKYSLSDLQQMVEVVKPLFNGKWEPEKDPKAIHWIALFLIPQIITLLTAKGIL